MQDTNEDITRQQNKGRNVERNTLPGCPSIVPSKRPKRVKHRFFRVGRLPAKSVSGPLIESSILNDGSACAACAA